MVVHDGELLGEVVVSLTSNYYRQASRRLIWSGIWTIFVVVASLIIATGFLLRTFLSNPLHRLGEIVNSYASGAYTAAEPDIPWIEFQPFVKVLGEMGRTITTQMGELRDAEKKYRDIFENSVVGIFQATPGGRLLSANPILATMLGYDSVEDLMSCVTDVRAQIYVNPERRDEFVGLMKQGKNVSGFEVQCRRRDGSMMWVALHARPVLDEKGGLVLTEGIAQDISYRKEAEEERNRLEEQLRQSQKMEVVGLLAGGIAHDFNNLLTPIMGFSELLILDFPEGDQRRELLQDIKEAARRAKDLTHRLLTFSRKQIIELKEIDLGEIIRQFETILRRTIRENISIETHIASTLSRVRADPGQIEQVLANLSVNAQDAMPGGGVITIEARDIDLDESYTGNHLEIVPGHYVMLAVSDTGVGMDSATLKHIFEPFFTTKEPGKGTGLGLSTVYGIVKQHGGSINAYSEPGHGTTLKIFIPRIPDTATGGNFPASQPEAVERGTGTILIVEDDAMVRTLAGRMLTGLGYTVLIAGTAESCFELVEKHGAAIDLLLTDVIMPKMSGKELSEQVRRMVPGMKVLFMSGYSSDVIGNHDVGEKGALFIQKPFSLQALSSKIREALRNRV
jgi:PAS domain S-box-containing protein